MRLVDADALRDELERCPFLAQDSTAELMQARTVFVLIDAAPTIACERCRKWDRDDRSPLNDDWHRCASWGRLWTSGGFGCAAFEAAE